MATLGSKIIYWLPRILSLAFVAFLSIFAFDVFEGDQRWWQTAIALFMHLIPSFVLLALTIIAWKRDLVGAVTFIGAAILYAWLIGIDRPISWYLVISGPALIVGILYLANWQQK